MNFLAHFHLARDDAGLRLGAFLGDFVKGPINSVSFKQQLNAAALPQNTVAGIMLHRKIDGYFDQMPQLKIIEATLPIECLRVKGILYDLFFDYALSHHWQLHHHHSLKTFEANTIKLLDEHIDKLNERAGRLVKRMRKHQLLTRYHEKELINAIANGIGKKLRLEDQMKKAQQHMWAHETLWLDCFHECYPALKIFSKAQQLELLSNSKANAAQQNS